VKGLITAVNVTTHNLNVRLYDDEWSPLGDYQNESMILYSLTTKRGGDLYACIYNNNSHALEIVLDLKYGVEARDWTEVALKGQLKPLELEMTRMAELIDSMRVGVHEIIAKEDANLLEADSVSDSLYLYSVFTMLVSVALSIYQVRFMKSFFKAKKLV